MKKSKAALVILGFGAATAVCVQAAAQDSGVYLGGSLGNATAKDSCNNATVHCDHGDTSWGLQAGYQFSRSFAAEIGYRNLGRISSQGDGVSSAQVKSQLGEALLTAGWPIERVTVYGKGGLYYANSKLKSNFLMEGSNWNVGWTLGVGLRYDFSRRFGVRLEWQRYNNLRGDAVGFRSDVDVRSLGVTFKF